MAYTSCTCIFQSATKNRKRCVKFQHVSISLNNTKTSFKTRSVSVDRSPRVTRQMLLNSLSTFHIRSRRDYARIWFNYLFKRLFRFERNMKNIILAVQRVRKTVIKKRVKYKTTTIRTEKNYINYWLDKYFTEGALGRHRIV